MATDTTIKDFQNQVEEWGVGMVKLHFENADPEKDFMIVGVSGRDGILDAKAALEALDAYWATLEDDDPVVPLKITIEPA